MWDESLQRLALLELLDRGTLKRRVAQAKAYDALEELPWTSSTGRRDEITLVEDRRRELVNLLERVWSTWREALGELTARGLPPTPDGWRKLLDARRTEGLPDLPARINRRTAAALLAPHSKAGLTEDRLVALGDSEPTHDGVVRLRPPPGLRARGGTGEVDLAAVAAVLGEVAIPERAFMDGLEFAGAAPRAVLLVENLGAWRDLTAPDGWLVAHMPGWDTATADRMLSALPDVPVVHFGDLDPNGLRIYLHVRARRPDALWFVPEFWAELVETHARPTSWPPELELGGAPQLVRELAGRGLWLEQETIVLDPRLARQLEVCIA